LKQLDKAESEKEFVSSVKDLLHSFNFFKYNFIEFTVAAIKQADSLAYSNSHFLEEVLSSKAKESFKEANAGQVTTLVAALLSSLKHNKAYLNKDSCIRMLGHVVFECQEMKDGQVRDIYSSIEKVCFDPKEGGKPQRLALNCIANLLLK